MNSKMKLSSIRILALVLVTGLLASGCSKAEEDLEEMVSSDEPDRKATAVLQPLNDSGVTGTVTFAEEGEFVRVTATVNGLSKGKHGFHIHEGTSCEDWGGHFNPDSTQHGSPDEPERHVGDLGQLVAESDSTAHFERVDRAISLLGDQSIVRHAVIVHRGEDEYLPQPSGDSGTEVACGLIEMEWDTGERVPDPMMP